MPHIPEEELHAYLDQALSRSQCVEIESHLAACAQCRATRDGIAALRDRTTALLAVLAPPTRISPSYDTLRRRHLGESARRHRVLRRAIWAASFIGAIALGWSARVWQDTQDEPSRRPETAENSPGVVEAAPPSSPGGAGTSLAITDTAASITPGEGATMSDPPREVAGPVQAPLEREDPPVAPPTLRQTRVLPNPFLEDGTPRQVALDTTPTRAPAPEREALPVLPARALAEQRRLDTRDPDGLWRLVDVAGAEEESGAPLPRVAGLPVIQVKIQGVNPNERIVAVDQQLATGEMIRTIEGPAGPVSELLARGAIRTAASETMVQLRQGNRMVAITGQLPSDSLRALLVRLPIPSDRTVPRPTTQAVPQISPSP